MADNVPVPKKRTLGWTILGVFFAVGLYLGFARLNPTIEASIKTLVAVALVLGSIAVLLGSRVDHQRKRQTRVSAIAVIVFGVAQVIPSFTVSITMTILAVLLIWAAALGIPTRLFAPRS